MEPCIHLKLYVSFCVTPCMYIYFACHDSSFTVWKEGLVCGRGDGGRATCAFKVILVISLSLSQAEQFAGYPIVSTVYSKTLHLFLVANQLKESVFLFDITDLLLLRVS